MAEISIYNDVVSVRRKKEPYDKQVVITFEGGLEITMWDTDYHFVVVPGEDSADYNSR